MGKSYFIENEGTIAWYKENTTIFHREDGPAIEYFNGRKEWWQNGKRHRENGPAIETPAETKFWYQNGKLHRLDGPAVEEINGTKWWYQNGVLHRTDGPAVVSHVDGNDYYFLNNIEYPNIKTDEEWIIFQIIN